MGMGQDIEHRHMARALALGWAALGTTSPNPAVGCVVAHGDTVVGEGWTQPPGGEHAEAMALRLAGDAARGAAVYVTLEPCNHYGRTPPCADAVIAAGVARVHIAVRDPNPNVAGDGAAALRAAGIETHVVADDAAHAADAARLIEAFAKHSRTRRPFVTAKYAMSLDGKIAARTGDSKWISGDASRAYAHLLRAQSDAIMVGVNTAIADDPQLTARNVDGTALAHQPLRVVLDSRGRLPHNARMLSAPGDTLIAVVDAAAKYAADSTYAKRTAVDSADAAQYAAAAADSAAELASNSGLAPNSGLAWDGAEVVRLPAANAANASANVGNATNAPANAAGGVDLRALLALLGERDVTSVLVEGGGAVLGTLFDLRLVDKVVSFVAPVIIGGRDAVSPVGGAGVADMADALRLQDVQVRRFGEDVAVIGYIR